MDFVAGDLALKEHGLPREPFLQGKNEISQAVADWLIPIDFDRLERVGMVAEDKVGAGIDSMAGNHFLM